MSQHYTNSMDEICVPVIKKILGHYLELNPNYNNGVQRNQQPNGKVCKGKKQSKGSMNPTNIRTGWWVTTDENFVCCYNSKEEALDHIKYQKEKMHSNKNWYIQYISIQFGEYLSFPCDEH